jgi:hypothetical protein
MDQNFTEPLVTANPGIIDVSYHDFNGLPVVNNGRQLFWDW